MNTGLPETWLSTALKDVAYFQEGPGLRKFQYREKGVPFLNIQTLVNERVDKAKCKYLDPEEVEKKYQHFLLDTNDIVCSSSGTIGKTAVIQDSDKPLMLNTSVIRFRPHCPSILNRGFLHIFLKSQNFLDQAKRASTGSAQVNFGPTHLQTFSMPIPPLNEQTRIVEKIEELFSELDKGVESLKTAQQQLKVYRQALLKQAFEGKLTEQWRKDNPDKVESAEELLARIKAEREARYQQQLIDWERDVVNWETSGKDGKKPSKPKKIQEAAELTNSEREHLAILPASWCWSKTAQCFAVYVGATPSRKKPSFWHGETPWVSSGEVAFCRISNTKEKITYEGLSNASTELHPIGTVMLAMIGEGKTRGQPAILDIPAAHNQNTAAIRVSEAGCSPEYFYYYLAYQYQITRNIGSGNNQKALNKERVSNLIFPLAPFAEQTKVAELLDTQFSVLDQMENEISVNLQRSEALRQSILKKAFSGQLVVQDPNDEPASELLQRIRIEREAAEQAEKEAKAKAKKAAPKRKLKATKPTAA